MKSKIESKMSKIQNGTISCIKSKSKYRKRIPCSWCHKLIDVTNEDRDLCDFCCQFKSPGEMARMKELMEKITK